MKFKRYENKHVSLTIDLDEVLSIVCNYDTANGWLYMLCDHHRFKLYTALTRIAYTTCYAQYGKLW